jgi:endonuclease YncB( thermonuclease family)
MESLTEQQCQEFRPLAERRVVKVVRVLDGDTVMIGWIVNGIPYKSSVRLYGINAAEVHTKDLLEKQVGLEMKAELEKVVLNKLVTLYDVGKDKFGRILSKIRVGDNIQDVSEYMLQFRGVKAYFGDKKTAWDFTDTDVSTNGPAPVMSTAYHHPAPNKSAKIKQRKQWFKYFKQFQRLWKQLTK